MADVKLVTRCPRWQHRYAASTSSIIVNVTSAYRVCYRNGWGEKGFEEIESGDSDDGGDDKMMIIAKIREIKIMQLISMMMRIIIRIILVIEIMLMRIIMMTQKMMI